MLRLYANKLNIISTLNSGVVIAASRWVYVYKVLKIETEQRSADREHAILNGRSSEVVPIDINTRLARVYRYNTQIPSYRSTRR